MGAKFNMRKRCPFCGGSYLVSHLDSDCSFVRERIDKLAEALKKNSEDPQSRGITVAVLQRFIANRRALLSVYWQEKLRLMDNMVECRNGTMQENTTMDLNLLECILREWLLGAVAYFRSRGRPPKPLKQQSIRQQQFALAKKLASYLMEELGLTYRLDDHAGFEESMRC